MFFERKDFSEQKNCCFRWECGKTVMRQPGAAVMSHTFLFLQIEHLHGGYVMGNKGQSDKE